MLLVLVAEKYYAELLSRHCSIENLSKKECAVKYDSRSVYLQSHIDRMQGGYALLCSLVHSQSPNLPCNGGFVLAR